MRVCVWKCVALVRFVHLLTMEVTLCAVAISCVTVVVIALLQAWRVLNWVWLRPKKVERLLRQQGLKGNPYRLLYGDSKEMNMVDKEGRRRPLNNLSHDILPRVLPFYHHSLKKFGKMFFTWNGTSPTVIVMDPDLIAEILSKNNSFKKPKPSAVLSTVLSGLAGYEGEKWAKHRRIMNPAFYSEKLKLMLPAIQLSCIEMISKWEEMVSAGKGSCELDVWPYLNKLAADMISRTAFGSNYEEGSRIFELQKEQLGLFFRNLRSLPIPGRRFIPTKTNKRIKEIYNEVQMLLKGLINKRQRAMELGEASAKDDLLSILLKSNLKEIEEHGNSKSAGMSMDDVIKECKLFYFAGTETTAQLLTWTMILLSMHPNWQMKAREEVLKTFGNNKPDYDGIKQLKIVTMILNEVLRLYSPTVMIPRDICKETKLGEMTLPAGINIIIPVTFVHHDFENWSEDAEEFNPKRFSEGIAKATKKQGSFIPFGQGPRICIGNNFAMLETKMALTMVLQCFSFELSPSYTHAPTYHITLQPQNGAHLILHKL